MVDKIIKFSWIILRFEGSWRLLKIDKKFLVFARCSLMVIANLFYFTALVVLPLADAAALFFVAPIFISILSSILLKETVGTRRITAIIVGLAGIIIVMRPLNGMTNNTHFLIYLLPVAAAFCYASAQVMARKLGATTRASVMAFYLHLIFILVSIVFGAIIGDGKYVNLSNNPSLVFLFRPWEWPLISDWPLLIFLGALSGVVAYCVTKAYVLAEASFVAPFEYIAIPFSIFWGIIIFGDWPSVLSWIGMSLILSGGIYAIYRERVREIEIISKIPMPASAAMYQKPNIENESQD